MAVTASQMAATKRYVDKNMQRVGMNINKKTMGDVIEQLNKVASKQGYIVALIRSDLSRKNEGCILIEGETVPVTDICQYADIISERFEHIRSALDAEALRDVENAFLPGTEAYIILMEYLRRTGETVKL